MRWARFRWLTTLIGIVVLNAVLPAAAADSASGAAVGGVVIDDSGQPLAGVCIELEGNGGPYRTVTDQAGQWRVDSVANGVVFVSINQCEDAIAGFATQWWPPGPNPLVSHGVIMAGADVLDVEVILPPAGEVSGQVEDSLGAPVEGACIVASVDGETVGRTRTTRAGTYLLASLPPATYDIEASDCTDPATLLPAAVAEVTVSGTTNRHLEPLRMREGGAIAGIVTSRHTAAQISGACLTLWTAEAEVGAGLYRGFAISGQDPLGAALEEPGQFTFAGVEPGTYRVFLGFDFCATPHDDGYAEMWFRDAVPPDGQPLDVEVVVGEVTDGIDAVLTPIASTERLCPWPPDPGLEDVEEASPHGRDIACALAVGLMGESGKQSFGPDIATTRGEFASALVATFARAGMALSEDVPDAFDDDNISEHRLALDQLAAVGVILGTSPGQADAELALTREQAATLLIRSHAVLTGQRILSEPDLWSDDEISPHQADLNSAGNAALILGTGGGTVGPDQPVTRAQTASLLTRLVDRTGRDTTR